MKLYYESGHPAAKRLQKEIPGSFALGNQLEVLDRPNDGDLPTPPDGTPFAIRETPAFDDSLDVFWPEAAPQFDLIYAHTKDVMNWRYADPRAGDFTITLAEHDGLLLGYVITRCSRRPRLHRRPARAPEPDRRRRRARALRTHAVPRGILGAHRVLASLAASVSTGSCAISASRRVEALCAFVTGHSSRPNETSLCSKSPPRVSTSQPVTPTSYNRTRYNTPAMPELIPLPSQPLDTPWPVDGWPAGEPPPRVAPELDASSTPPSRSRSRRRPSKRTPCSSSTAAASSPSATPPASHNPTRCPPGRWRRACSTRPSASSSATAGCASAIARRSLPGSSPAIRAPRSRSLRSCT